MTPLLHTSTFHSSLVCLWINENLGTDKKVMTAKTFVTPEGLPPTNSTTIHHTRRTYLQAMVWMGCSENMDPTKWGWNLQRDKLIPIVMDSTPASDVLLKMIQCDCVGGSSTLRHSCKKFGLECTAACGSCRDGNCENVNNAPILYDNED